MLSAAARDPGWQLRGDGVQKYDGDCIGQLSTSCSNWCSVMSRTAPSCKTCFANSVGMWKSVRPSAGHTWLLCQWPARTTARMEPPSSGNCLPRLSWAMMLHERLLCWEADWPCCQLLSSSTKWKPALELQIQHRWWSYAEKGRSFLLQ
jgi:hypothetical protein